MDSRADNSISFFISFLSVSFSAYFLFLFTSRGTLLVAQLLEALRYKSEGRGFDSRWCHWNFLLT